MILSGMRSSSYSAAVQLLVCSLAAAVLLSQIASAEEWQKITIKKPDGSTFQLVVTQHYDTVDMVKGQIERHEGIAAGKQRLYYKDELLDDATKIRHYSIGTGSVLDLEYDQ